MKAVPRSMRHLPVYLTETDQDDAWRNENNGWVQRVYGEIDWWNHQAGNQVIRAVILYRWPNVDRWGIDGKAGVIDDFRQAMTHKYNWETVAQAKPGTTPTADRKAQAEAAVSRHAPRAAACRTDQTGRRHQPDPLRTHRQDRQGALCRVLPPVWAGPHRLPDHRRVRPRRERAENAGLAAAEHGGVAGRHPAAAGGPGGSRAARQGGETREADRATPIGWRRTGRAARSPTSRKPAARRGALRRTTADRHPVPRDQPHRGAARGGRRSRGAGAARQVARHRRPVLHHRRRPDPADQSDRRGRHARSGLDLQRHQHLRGRQLR